MIFFLQFILVPHVLCIFQSMFLHKIFNQNISIAPKSQFLESLALAVFVGLDFKKYLKYREEPNVCNLKTSEENYHWKRKQGPDGSSHGLAVPLDALLAYLVSTFMSQICSWSWSGWYWYRYLNSLIPIHSKAHSCKLLII